MKLRRTAPYSRVRKNPVVNPTIATTCLNPTPEVESTAWTAIALLTQPSESSQHLGIGGPIGGGSMFVKHLEVHHIYSWLQHFNDEAFNEILYNRITRNQALAFLYLMTGVNEDEKPPAYDKVTVMNELTAEWRKLGSLWSKDSGDPWLEPEKAKELVDAHRNKFASKSGAWGKRVTPAHCPHPGKKMILKQIIALNDAEMAPELGGGDYQEEGAESEMEVVYEIKCLKREFHLFVFDAEGRTLDDVILPFPENGLYFITKVDGVPSFPHNGDTDNMIACEEYIQSLPDAKTKPLLRNTLSGATKKIVAAEKQPATPRARAPKTPSPPRLGGGDRTPSPLPLQDVDFKASNKTKAMQTEEVQRLPPSDSEADAWEEWPRL